MGNPAWVIGYDGSFNYLRHDGMDRDPERRAALALKSPSLAAPSPAGESSPNGLAAVGSA
jgi:hypothetical protein